MELNFFIITDMIGLVAFSIGGFLIAREHKLDLLGTLISVFSTALVGGIMRDTIASNTPFAFSHMYPSACVLITFLIIYLTKWYKKYYIEQHTLFVLIDAIGLSSFSITGALVGIDVGFNLFGILFLSSLTAIGGGMFRDVLLNITPMFLERGFYLSVTFITAFIVIILHYYNLIHEYSLMIVFVFGISIRMLGYMKDWHLPKL